MFTEHLPVGLHYLSLIFTNILSGWYIIPHFTNMKHSRECGQWTPQILHTQNSAHVSLNSTPSSVSSDL